ncbi:unnamed protein product, partial [Mesorhabditis belari]|uniref:B box-type domain-containing protein n=1 Tax=Mesorhabditis belari TaxID=2138241 RepID=A0AAF3FU51_9BILA
MVGIRAIPETHRFCVECQFNYHVDATFFCPTCDKIVCGACAYRRHKKHRCEDLTSKEMETSCRVECQATRHSFNDYNKVHRGIQENLTHLVEKIEEFLLEKIDNVRMMEKFDEGMRENVACSDYRQFFKRTSKEYLQHARNFENKMHTFFKKLEGEQLQRGPVDDETPNDEEEEVANTQDD